MNKVINRNCPSGSSDVGLTEQKLQISITNIFKELKEVMSKELIRSMRTMFHQKRISVKREIRLEYYLAIKINEV